MSVTVLDSEEEEYQEKVYIHDKVSDSMQGKIVCDTSDSVIDVSDDDDDVQSNHHQYHQ